MPCSVPSCKEKREEKKSTFSIPKDSKLLCLWEKSLGFKLKRTSRICELHFKSEDVIKTWVSGKGVNTYTICLKRSKLRPGAIPAISYTKNECLIKTSKLVESDVEEILILSPINDKISEEVYCVELDHCYATKDQTIKNTNSRENNHMRLSMSPIEPIEDVSLFDFALKNVNLINIPGKWYCNITKHGQLDDKIGFHKLSTLKDDLFRSIEKQLILNKDLNIFIQVNGKKVPNTEFNILSNYKLKEIEELENILKELDIAKVCSGAGSVNKYQDIQSRLIGPQFEKSFGQWYHSNCTRIITTNNNNHNQKHKSNSKCLWCKRLWYSIMKKKMKKTEKFHYTLNKDETIKQLQKKICTIRQKYSRANRRNERLHETVIEIRNKMKEISDSSLKNIIDAANIPVRQSEVIYEIFNAAKMKNSKNRKYSENWIIQCLLFQMRSPSGYKFIKDKNILPLPCVNTIRKHLMLAKMELVK